MTTTSQRASRAVVVVGATSGIGLATAHRLSAAGDRLLLVARDEGRLAAVAAALPGPASYVAADVTDAEAVERAVGACVHVHGAVDAVITSAQAMAYGTVEQVPAEAVRHMSDVAIGGVVHLAQSALPRFRAQGHGHLVVVSSLLAQIAVPSMGAYYAAKWGQLGLVRTLQTEVRRVPGVHVSLVLPGAIDTPIYHQAGTYAGSLGSAPPPVVSADAVAAACERCLEHPRRMVHVGPVNRLAVAGSRVVPGLYDLLAGPLVDRIVLRGPAAADDPGNVFDAVPQGEGLSGGWSPLGTLRDARGRHRWGRRRR